MSRVGRGLPARSRLCWRPRSAPAPPVVLPGGSFRLGPRRFLEAHDDHALPVLGSGPPPDPASSRANRSRPGDSFATSGGFDRSIFVILSAVEEVSLERTLRIVRIRPRRATPMRNPRSSSPDHLRGRPSAMLSRPSQGDDARPPIPELRRGSSPRSTVGPEGDPGQSPVRIPLATPGPPEADPPDLARLGPVDRVAEELEPEPARGTASARRGTGASTSRSGRPASGARRGSSRGCPTRCSAKLLRSRCRSIQS